MITCLFLLCGLLLAFFMTVNSEMKASRLVASGVHTKDLTDSVTNLVIAQIRDATSGGANVAWASQPGMIRTWGSEVGSSKASASAKARACYKLYSAKKMTWASTDGDFLSEIADDVPADWFSQGALFTDLNLPVKGLDGTAQYPILDPAAAGTAVGLTITNPPANSTDSAPMPVRWLYVLKDGTITAPAAGTPGTSSSGSTATWTAGDRSTPTKDNPIVGRIAFWTDDDTNKININTAAGDLWSDTSSPGTFWDTPRTWSPLDVAFATNQIINGEYQRYPGHPATVYLSAVFPDLTRDQIGAIVPRIVDGGSKGGTVRSTQAGPPLTPDADRLYASVDELVYKPDRTAQTSITRSQLEQSRFFLTASSRAPETTLFNTPRISIWPLSRDETTSAGAQARTPWDSLIAFCSTVGQQHYFFTRDTASRSATLPREHAGSPWLDYYGSQTYGSMDGRVDASRNRQLFSYLQNLTGRPVPGFTDTTTFTGKYGADRDQILTEIFDYIRSTNLFDDTLTPTANSMSDSGKQFTARRTSATGTAAGHGQVAPIHIASSGAPGDRTKDNMGFGRFHTLSEFGLVFICTADGSVDPKKPNPTTEEALKIKSNTAANVTLKNITTVDARGVPLEATQRSIEAMVVLELFSPSQGWTGIHDDINIRVKGLDQFTLGGKALNMPSDGNIQLTNGDVFDGRSWGGTNGFRYTLNGRCTPARGSIPQDSGYSAGNAYPFISFPVVVDVNTAGGTMVFTGGQVTVEIYSSAANASETNNLVQTIVIDVPAGNFPIPTLVTTGTAPSSGNSSSGTFYYSSPTTTPEHWWTFRRYGAFPTGTLPSTDNTQDHTYDGTAGRIFGIDRGEGGNLSPGVGSLFRQEDVVRTLMPYHGDYRLVAASPYVYKDNNGNGIFQKHAAWADTSIRLAHTLQVEASSNNIQRDHANVTTSDTATPWVAQPSGKLVAKAQYSTSRFPDGPHVFSYNTSTGQPIVPSGFATNLPETNGDWDTGITVVPDGAYINKPDEGNDFRNFGTQIPYYDVNWTEQSGGATLFSPNRQVPSAGMFGSLPTGVKAGTPWQTLLFRPDLNGTHPGARSGYPKDHLFLDLFWMPVVEPYAISEPFSTAGKINMNYQIMPFTYIERTTALRALLRSERVAAIPFANAGTYKNNGGSMIAETRFTVNPEGTLAQFKQRFDTGDIFRSASEICDLHIVPSSVTGITESSSASIVNTRMKLFWSTNRLTGDNLRERPYTTLYPRLTTKSNTYTVHYRVQALQQATPARNSGAIPWAVWDESKDLILSESRGSTTLERYIDPMDPNIADFATTFTGDSTENLDTYCRYRVINSRKFTP